MNSNEVSYMSRDSVLIKWISLTNHEKNIWVAEVIDGYKNTGDSTWSKGCGKQEVPKELLPWYTSKQTGYAFELFEKVCDPNRTSIHPIGNGSMGLVYIINYDDTTICTHESLREAICLFGLISKLCDWNEFVN